MGKICASRYFGGKNAHLDFILPLFPPDVEHIIDAFGGSGVVVLNADDGNGRVPHPHITYNDIDARLRAFFKPLREQPEALIKAVSLSPHSRRDFEEIHARENWDGSSAVEQARQAFILFTQSLNYLGSNRDLN